MAIIKFEGINVLQRSNEWPTNNLRTSPVNVQAVYVDNFRMEILC